MDSSNIPVKDLTNTRVFGRDITNIVNNTQEVKAIHLIPSYFSFV